MKNKTLVLFLILSVFFVQDGFGRRSSGRSSSSTKGRSTGLWGNNGKKKSNSGNAPAPKPEARPDVGVPAPKPKPSAPKADSVQKSSVARTNTAPGSNSQNNQRPVGWNLPAQHGQPQTKSFANQQHSGAYNQPGGYGQHVQPSQTSGFGQPGGVYNNYGQTAHGGVHQPGQTGYGGMQQSGQSGYGGYGGMHQPAQGYGGMHQPSHGYGGMHQPNQGYGGMHQPNQGYGGMHQPNQGYGGMQQPAQGYGGYGGMHQPAHGYSGYGNYGGYGGGGMMGGFGGGMMGGLGGGMMGQKRGFGSGFATTAFTSVATGLLVWSLMRGGRSQNYNVYNHYNNPEAVPQNIPVAANGITLCPDNATLLCAANTVPLCTSNETILCVVTAGATVPCVDNSTASCVDTKVPCTADCGVNKENTTLVLHCIANATVSGQVNIADGNKEAVDATMSLFKQSHGGSDTVLCVTTMAMPSSEDEEAARKKVEAVLSSSTIVPPLLLSTNEPNINESSTIDSQNETGYGVPFLR